MTAIQASADSGECLIQWTETTLPALCGISRYLCALVCSGNVHLCQAHCVPGFLEES